MLDEIFNNIINTCNSYGCNFYIELLLVHLNNILFIILIMNSFAAENNLTSKGKYGCAHTRFKMSRFQF